MSKRRKRTTQPDSKDQRIAELEEQLSQALATIQKLQKLEKEVERLQARVEELERAGKRQAMGGEAEAAGTQARTGEVCASRAAKGSSDARDEGSQVARLSGLWG
ncbi:MAG TPA: hypothetical protein VFZ43_10765 [Anaerolineales bacterium]